MKTQHPRLWCHFVLLSCLPPPLYFYCLSVCWVPGCLAWGPWLGHTCCRPRFSNSIKRTDGYIVRRLLKWLKSQLFLSFPWLRLGRSAVSVQWWVTLITYPQSQIWKGWLHIKLIVLLSKFLQSHARSCLRFSIPNIQPTDLKKKK